MAEERRAAPRQEAYISAALETSQGRSTIAITRDISSTGLLILTRIQPALGDVLKLTVLLAGTQRSLSGKVVRLEALEHELWRYKVALAIDSAEPVLAELRATLAEPTTPR